MQSLEYVLLIINLINLFLIYNILTFMYKNIVGREVHYPVIDKEDNINKRHVDFDARIKYLNKFLNSSDRRANSPKKAKSETSDEHVGSPSEDGLYDIEDYKFPNIFDENDTGVEVITEEYEKQLDDYILTKQKK